VLWSETTNAKNKESTSNTKRINGSIDMKKVFYCSVTGVLIDHKEMTMQRRNVSGFYITKWSQDAAENAHAWFKEHYPECGTPINNHIERISWVRYILYKLKMNILRKSNITKV
jgi:hypothetical protein